MMNVSLILGWLFLVIGIACWVFVFKCLYLLFRTRIIVDLPLSQQIKEFSIQEKGGFSIWQVGPLLKQVPMLFSQPQLTDLTRQQVVKLSLSIGRATKNSFSQSAMLVFYCELDVGKYCLEVFAGSSLHTIEERISKAILTTIPIGRASNQQYHFQLRESLTKKQRLLMPIFVFIGLFFFLQGLFTILNLLFDIPMETMLL